MNCEVCHDETNGLASYDFIWLCDACEIMRRNPTDDWTNLYDVAILLMANHHRLMKDRLLAYMKHTASLGYLVEESLELSYPDTLVLCRLTDSNALNVFLERSGLVEQVYRIMDAVEAETSPIGGS